MRFVTSTSTLIVLAATVLVGGCKSTPQAVPTGFLSDYSRLQQVDDRTLRYLGPNLGSYSTFIIDPVVVHFHEEAKGDTSDPDTLTRMTTYLRGALANAIKDRYGITAQPGPGVARLRVAITDIDKASTVSKLIPIGKALGAGRGGASMEAELLDSVTGQQLGAVIESSPGTVLSLGAAKWGDAEAAMDKWARRFRQRLDQAYGF